MLSRGLADGRVDLPRAEILFHVLTSGLHQLWPGADLLHLRRRGVTPHVLLLDYSVQARSLPQAVDDVLHHLLLPRGMLRASQQTVPEGSLPLRGHRRGLLSSGYSRKYTWLGALT